jgi:serine/threonine protein kinase
MDKIIGEEIGGCLIESRIGQGGMGIVYKAHHLALDIPVALKLLHPLLPHTGDIERFLREARVAARLRHPNIVGVLNVGSDDERHYIIMEFIGGCNLLSLVKNEGRVNISRGIDITCQALDALDCMFKNSIVHRDIKPENILIDEQGLVKLTDCGLARMMTDRTITQPSIMIGSPNYIAPEQAENSRNADHRADIYSLGCTLFHLLAGKPPFEGESPIQIVLDHLRKEPPMLHDFDPSIPRSISHVVRKMMDKQPQNRPQTPLEAKEELIDALSRKEPAHSTQKIKPITSSIDKITTPKRSRAAYIIAATILAVAAIAGFTIITISSNNSQKVTTTNVQKSTDSRLNNSDGVQNSSNDEDQTLLKEIQNGNNDRVKVLLNTGSNPNSGDIPPLVIAVQSNSELIVRMLLEKGANPNFTDPSGRTALHYALYIQNTPLIRLLLAFKADPNKLDPSGKKPLELTNNPQIAELLRQNGAY